MQPRPTRIWTLTLVAAGGSALVACGLSTIGTSTDESFESPDAGNRDQESPSDGGGTVVVEGGKAVGGDAATTNRCASGCTATCPEACADAMVCVGTSTKEFCIATGKCVDGCDNNSNCTSAQDDCHVCDPGAGFPGEGGAGNPRRICSAQSTGFCSTGQYAHCRCNKASDCHEDNEVCTTGGICVPCGQAGATTSGLVCKCNPAAKCPASGGDCNCP